MLPMAAAGAIPAVWLRDSRRHEKIRSSEGKSRHSAAGGDAKRNVSELLSLLRLTDADLGTSNWDQLLLAPLCEARPEDDGRVKMSNFLKQLSQISLLMTSHPITPLSNRNGGGKSFRNKI